MTLPFHELTSKARQCTWRWLPGLFAATLTVLAAKLGVFQSFQSFTYNGLFCLRGSIPWDQRVVVVEIDDQSIQNLGQFPLDRQYYTRFLQQLANSPPSVIGIDIVLSEVSDDDADLASAMDHLNRVVLGLGWNNNGEAILPVPKLTDHAVNIGHVLNRQSDDGVTRTVEPYIQSVPALGIAIAQAYDLIQEPINIPDEQAFDSQTFWINWPGPSQTAQSYSFHDVLTGQVDTRIFQDKILLLGSTASGDSPLFTPFDRNPPTAGVYLHAAVVSNLLQGNRLYRVGPEWNLLMLLMLGPLLGLVSSYRTWRFRWMSWLVICVGWYALGVLCLSLNILLPVFWPILLVTTTYGLTEAVERWRANAYLHAEVYRLWDTYHSDLITLEHLDTKPPMSATNFHTRWASLPWSSNGERPARFTRSVAIQRVSQLADLADLFGRSQSLHAAIAQNLSVGIIAADLDGTVWMCNPVAASLLQLTVGRSFVNQLIPDWATVDHWNHILAQIGQSELPRWEVQRDNTWFELTIEPLFYPKQSDHDGPLQNVQVEKPPGLLLMIKDITAFKQVETDMRNALAEALEFSELKTRFVAMASHELRTPLSVIRTCIELLRTYGLEIPPERHQDYLENMKASVMTMKALIDDVLVLGKTEARGLKLDPKPLDLTLFCQNLIQQIQPDTSPVERVHLTIDTHARQHILDSDLLFLILNNLLSNALKYSPEETCVYLDVSGRDDSVLIKVCDRGMGIPKEYQKHLFEEFHRGPNVGKIPGTGLGLSIVKRCVDLHGGTIHVESRMGVGTTFSVNLQSRPGGKTYPLK
ncbi:MAG: CHASE2 domain-containing protein [Cyanobacteria bacterium P01_A01_bin.37]